MDNYQYNPITNSWDLVGVSKDKLNQILAAVNAPIVFAGTVIVVDNGGAEANNIAVHSVNEELTFDTHITPDETLLSEIECAPGWVWVVSEGGLSHELGQLNTGDQILIVSPTDGQGLHAEVLNNIVPIGYQFMGVADTTTNDNDVDVNVKCAWITGTPGTYTGLGNIVVDDNELAVILREPSGGGVPVYTKRTLNKYVLTSNIDDTGLANPAENSVAKATDVMQLKVKLQGVTAEETKVILQKDSNWYDTKYVNATNGKIMDSSAGTTQYNGLLIVNCQGYKRVRFLGIKTSASSTTIGYGFSTSSTKPDPTDTETKQVSPVYAFETHADANAAKEYIVDVPEGANWFVCTIRKSDYSYHVMDLSDFYCYLENGETVIEAIKFKGGEVVKDVAIKDNTVDNLSTDVLSARQGMETDHKLGDVTFREERAEIFFSGVNQNLFKGKVFCSTGSSPYISGRTSDSNNSYAIINVEGVSRIRFLGATLASGSIDGSAKVMPGYAFFNEDNHSTASTNDGGFLVDRTGAVAWGCFDITGAIGMKEYIVDVPEGAKYVKLCRTYYDGIMIFGASTFYCYKQYGSTVSEDMAAKVSGSDMQGQWKWKKNLININDLVNANMFGSPLALGFDSNNPNCLMARLQLEDGMQYTASNVSIVKSGSKYYMQIFRFAADGQYINHKSYEAEETSTNHSTYNSTGKCTFIYNKSNVSGKEEAYQLIRLRFAQAPNTSTWQDWKNAQMEIGDEVTAVAPYHSERIFNKMLVPKNLVATELGSCSPSVVAGLEEGVNVEENCGSSSSSAKKWELLKWDVKGYKQVSLSGKVNASYYTFSIYTWADEDGNKLSTDQTIKVTSSIHSWSNVVLKVPEGARYLYATAWKVYKANYYMDGLEVFSTDVFMDYISSYVKDNSYQKEINILAIGNSYSQDSLAYVPFLAQRYGLTVNIAILMKSSSTITQAYNYFKNESKEYIYQYCFDNDYRWHSKGSSSDKLYSIQDALDEREWNVIMLNIGSMAGDEWKVVKDDNDSPGLSTIQKVNELYSRIADYVDYPVKFVGLMTYQHISVVNVYVHPDIPDDYDSTVKYQLQDEAMYQDGNDNTTRGIFESVMWNNKNHAPYGVNEYYWEVVESGTATAYDADATYSKNDIVSYNSVLYQSKDDNNRGHVPYGVNEYYWKYFYPAWSATATYSKDAVVRNPLTGEMIVSKQNGNTNHDPSSDDGTWWRTYEWDNSESYSESDFVIYDGIVFISKVSGNIGRTPTGSSADAYWFIYNRPYTETQIIDNYNSQKTSCERYLANTFGEGVIPVNTAIKNAYTVEHIKEIGAYKDAISNPTGYGYLTAGDGYHLQEGLPCQLAAYVVLLYIFKLLGMESYGIMGDNIMATAEWLDTKVIPGRQGMSTGFDGNDAANNLRFIQRCAVMAMKSPDTVTDMNIYYPPYNALVSSNSSFTSASDLVKSDAASALGITESQLDKLMLGRFATLVYDEDETLDIDSADGTTVSIGNGYLVIVVNNNLYSITVTN